MADELHHLIKMINQISNNQPRTLADEDAASKVASHINSFWAKSMRQKLHQHKDSIFSELTPVGQKALAQIRNSAS